MRLLRAIGIMLLFFIAGSIVASARGEVAPPPRYFGGDGNIGGWIGDGGSGPIFGFDDPWGKDFPWGGSGLKGGHIMDGGWTRGSGAGNPLGNGGNGGGSSGSGGGGTVRDTSSFGCPGECQRPSFTGPCIPLCYCRPYYHGYPGDLTCDRKRGADWTGQRCYIFGGDCPGEK